MPRLRSWGATRSEGNRVVIWTEWSIHNESLSSFQLFFFPNPDQIISNSLILTVEQNVYFKKTNTLWPGFPNFRFIDECDESSNVLVSFLWLGEYNPYTQGSDVNPYLRALLSSLFMCIQMCKPEIQPHTSACVQTEQLGHKHCWGKFIKKFYYILSETFSHV